MNDDTLAAEIARIEEQIEDLAEVAEGCRKFIFAGNTAIALGILVVAATIFGLVSVDAVLLLGALSAIIGGIVVAGSNASTRRNALAAAAAAEARRLALIDRVAPRLVIDAAGNDPD
ncbi:hypothetical protein [Rhodoplanes roseus]|uniref:Uncharacterized protein n=1 Tax=Rhodoplanes roseus TaxID=29409 RepID=A0A327L134_9BRAD|nr:hypothetical protein [Rhodoplanes roseus]RAI44669.1 hypothetical protein CH341_07940 [Rhodoplanes roseus]